MLLLADNFTIDFSSITGPIIQIVGTAIGAILTAALTAVLVRLFNLLGLKQDAETRAYVAPAAANMAALVVAKANELADKYGKVTTTNEMVAEAAALLVKAVPQGLQDLGVTDEKGVVTDKTKTIVEAQIAKLTLPAAAPQPTVAEPPRQEG